jgi:hypothetical protein
MALALALMVGRAVAAAAGAVAESPHQPDIYYIWHDGTRLAHGENPYAEIAPADVEGLSTKRPSYLPLFYLLVAASQWLGVHDYAAWTRVWRPLLRGTHLAIGIILASAVWRAGNPALGVFGALFWGMNRWPLYTVRVGQIDEIALLLLLVSLWSFPGHRRASFLLFGASLAVKHIAVVAAPLYLVWAWRGSDERTVWARLRAPAAAAAWIALIPVAISSPFIAWNPEAFGRSLLVPMTREAASHVSAAAAVGTLAGLSGFPARVPMVALALLVMVAAARGEIGRYRSVLLVLAVFTDFDPVLFLQYLAWIVPFLVLAACDGPSR